MHTYDNTYEIRLYDYKIMDYGFDIRIKCRPCDGLGGEFVKYAIRYRIIDKSIDSTLF